MATPTTPTTPAPRAHYRCPPAITARAAALAARVARGVAIPLSAILREALDRGLAQLEAEADITSPPPVPPGERYVERDAAALAAASIEAI